VKENHNSNWSQAKLFQHPCICSLENYQKKEANNPQLCRQQGRLISFCIQEAGGHQTLGDTGED